MTEQPRRLPRAVIKYELVALTGDHRKAVILNQLLYWTERAYDYDKFLMEESKRMAEYLGVEANVDLQHGWIYKSAKELIEETMLDISEQTLLRDMKVLEENGWIMRRRNPKYKWDRTWQYRVNILKVQRDLQALGFSLEGYALAKMEDPNSTVEDGCSKMEDQNINLEDQSLNLAEQYHKPLTKTTSNISIHTKPRRNAKNTNRVRDERYSAFYELFPDC